MSQNRGQVQSYVIYSRVSTDKQGRSGLGLDAQKADIQRYLSAHGKAIAEFTEIESGKHHKNPPALLQALDTCRRNRATLLIARLDRLARNVAFIASLMESGVEFVAVDMPHTSKFTIHILAAVAEHEREIISKRTKAALAAAKARGVKLGDPNPLAALKMANEARQLRPPPTHVMQFMKEQHGAGRSYRAIAAELNARDTYTPQGCRWYASTVRAALLRESVKERKNATAHPLYDDMADERNHESAVMSFLKSAEMPGIPVSADPSAGRGLAKTGGLLMPSDIQEAERMVDTFTSVGASSFVVTKLDINQALIWAKTYQAAELRDLVPAMVRTAKILKPCKTPEGIVAAGENLIIRPSGPEVLFVQLDDPPLDSSNGSGRQRL